LLTFRRFGEHHIIGVCSTYFKVATQDTNGGLFIMEHTNRKKGGPHRHLHHKENEWFYAIEGEYIIEVGFERFRLKAGDSLLAQLTSLDPQRHVDKPEGGLLKAGKLLGVFIGQCSSVRQVLT
jgi:hypothetical protein